MQASQSNTQAPRNPYASASLYVGDLDFSVTEATLFELFNSIGPVASIRVCRDSRTRRSLGYAYVNFHSVADAEKALSTMNFQQIRGKQCRVMWSQRDPRLRQSGKGNIFVKNLHESIDNKTLYDTFSVFGKILSCKVARNRNTDKSLGYGYVHYINPSNAQKAIDGVDGMTISEKKVSAELFKSKDERTKDAKPIEYTNVYIKYIPRGFGKENLIKLFEEGTGGKVTSGEYWEKEFGTAACLNFETVEQAKKAVEVFQGREMRDEVKESKDKEKTDEKDDEKKTEDSNTKENDETKNAENDNDIDLKEKEADKDVSKKDNETKEKTCLYVARAEKKREREENRNREKLKLRSNYSRNSSANLYIKNLTDECDDAQLKKIFESFGKIISARVMRDQYTNKSKLFGFVQFEKRENAINAKDSLQGKLEAGKPLYISIAQPKALRKKQLAKQIRNGRIRRYPNTMQRSMYTSIPAGPTTRGPYSYNPNNAMQQVYASQYRPPMMNAPPMMGTHPMMNQMPMNPMQMSQMSQMNQMQMNQMQRSMVNYNPMFGTNPANIANSQSQINTMQSLTNSNIASGFNQTQTNRPMPSQQQPSSIGIQQQPSNSMLNSHRNASSQPQISSQPQQVQPVVSSIGHSSSHQTSAPVLDSKPLTSEMLQSAKPAERKRLIGERLFPKIQVVEPRLAGKITGMLLEMDNTELLMLLQDQQALMNKINEALAVLKDHQQKQSQSNVASGANSSQPNRSQPNRSQPNRSQANRASSSNTNLSNI